MKKININKFLLLLSSLMCMGEVSYAQSNDNEDGVVKIEQYNQRLSVPNQLIIKFHDGAGVRRSETKSTRFKFPNNTKAENSVNSILDNYNIGSIECLGKEKTAKTKAGYWQTRSVKSSNGKEVWDKDISQMFLITLEANSDKMPQTDYLALIEKLKQDESIEFAEPNYIQYALGFESNNTYNSETIPYYNIDSGKYPKQSIQDKTSVKSYTEGTPDDPMYSQQWGIPATHLDELWQKPKLEGAKRKVIAIVDTGVDIDHPDLKDNIWTNEAESDGDTGEDDDNNGYIDDIHGWDFINQTGNMHDFNSHGTHCAGIAAALGDNGIGITGVNPDALIMPVTVLQSNGGGDIATIVKGINYAAENGADIISMSLGGYSYSIAEEQALAHAYQTAVLVAAAGNDGRAIDVRCCWDCRPAPKPMFPGAFTFVIGVQASDESNSAALWSNWDCDGPEYSQFSEDELYNYEVLAPGQYIFSTVPGGSYIKMSGTSTATPLVAGGISALLDRKDYVSKEVLLSSIIQTCKENVIDFNAVYSSDSAMSSVLQVVAIEENDTLSGNGNYTVEAGETIDIYPTLRNVGGFADSIQIWLELAGFEDTTIIQLPEDKVLLGKSLSSYAKAKSINPLTVKIRDNVADGRQISLLLKATSPQATDTTVFNYTMTVSNSVILKGFTNGNVTLTPDKQYKVEDFYAVMPNDTLYIMPGTTVKFDNEAQLVVSSLGYMYAHGTADSMITFTKADLAGAWKGFKGSISLKYCIVEEVFFGYLESPERPCFVIDSAENCVFRNNDFRTKGKYTYCNVFDNSSYAYFSPCIFGCYDVNETERSEDISHIYDKYNNQVNNYVYGLYDGHDATWMNEWNAWTNMINLYSAGGYHEYYIRDQHVQPVDLDDYIQDSVYMGSAKESIFRKHIYDRMTPGSTVLGLIDVSKVMSHPVWEAHGIVWKVEVNGHDAQDEFDSIPPLGVGKHEFKVYFNRAMDTSIAPMVAMGVRSPYTTTSIDEDGYWSQDSMIYIVYKTLTGKDAIDGLNRIYVDGAKDNEHFDIPYENQRFNVYVESSGSMSAGFQATAGLGRVELEWNNQEMNVDDFLGFNMYRYQYNQMQITDEDTVYLPGDTTMINTSLIVDTLFTDYDVVPGERYYYYYKILRTSLDENSPSRTVMAMPMTSVKGDANGSMTVDVADIITVINYISNQNPKPFIFDAADVNGDGAIDVLDIVGIISIIMGDNDSKKSDNTITAIYSVENDTLYITSPVPMGGVQFSFTTDKIQSLESLSRFEQFKQWTAEDNYMFMAYSLSGKQLPAGKNAIVKLNGADISKIILADTKGKNIIPIKADQTGLTDVITLQSAIMQTYPNPSKDNFTVTFAVGDKTIKSATLTFTDITGRVLSEKEFNINSTGEYSYNWNAEGLQNGMYFVQLRVDGQLAHTRKLIVNK
ncbi:MAG: S8 family serine peptidase [Bacteroidales bacterium]|nr:S8 family serine peptidase [Bacteroidales bacterium]